MTTIEAPDARYGQVAMVGDGVWAAIAADMGASLATRRKEALYKEALYEEG